MKYLHYIYQLFHIAHTLQLFFKPCNLAFMSANLFCRSLLLAAPAACGPAGVVVWAAEGIVPAPLASLLPKPWILCLKELLEIPPPIFCWGLELNVAAVWGLCCWGALPPKDGTWFSCSMSLLEFKPDGPEASLFCWTRLAKDPWTRLTNLLLLVFSGLLPPYTPWRPPAIPVFIVWLSWGLPVRPPIFLLPLLIAAHFWDSFELSYEKDVFKFCCD